MRASVRSCVRACVRACVFVCVCVGGGIIDLEQSLWTRCCALKILLLLFLLDNHLLSFDASKTPYVWPRL